MTCKDCIHYDMCERLNFSETIDDCEFFKNKSRFIELPCKVGDTVFELIQKCDPPFGTCPFSGGYGISRCGFGDDNRYKNCGAYIKEIPFSLCSFYNIGKTIFLTKEEAEKALRKEQKKK